MTTDAQEWLSIYDDVSELVSRSKYQTFTHNLKRWFALLDKQPVTAELVFQLERRTDFQAWYSRSEATVGSMVGSGDLVWPTEDEDRIGLQLALFRHFATGSVGVTDFAVNFLYSDNNFNVMAADVVGQFFDPLSRELRRYLARALTAPIEAWSVSIPASDRAVTINHNNPDYTAVTRDLDALEEAVRGSNDYPDTEDKAQRVAEIGAMRRLLAASRVRIDALIALVVRGLQHFAKTFADKVIGALAIAALAALGRLTGLW
jgi:hypothetical protein